MWNLVRLSLAYHRKTVFLLCAIALLFPKNGLVISAIVSVVLLSREDRERRLLLLLPLPVTPTQVGWARVVFPAVVVVLCTMAAAVFTCLPVAGRGADSLAEATRDLLLFALLLSWLLQLVLTMDELQSWGLGRFLGALRGGAVLFLLVIFSLTAALFLMISASYWVVGIGTLGLTLGLMGFTVFLFEQRPSFTSA